MPNVPATKIFAAPKSRSVFVDDDNDELRVFPYKTSSPECAKRFNKYSTGRHGMRAIVEYTEFRAGLMESVARVRCPSTSSLRPPS